MVNLLSIAIHKAKSTTQKDAENSNKKYTVEDLNSHISQAN